MINIIHDEDCCGCSSCEQACPQKCISLKEDKKGFKYPFVNEKLCINCGKCEKACPVLNVSPKRLPMASYAAKNKDEDIRKHSSSGGIFSLLAELIIKQGGVVFGASFNKEWLVEHSYTINIEEIGKFRGSKYVQSDINKTYTKTKIFLEKGQLVLFTGTPCQIQGLYKYLKKDYSNLFTLDFACHGIPSPLIWKQWIENIINQNDIKEIKTINFRHKKPSAKNYSFYISSDKGNLILKRGQNPYMIGYLNNLFIRPICYRCPFKGKYASDLTISDFWGLQLIHPEFEDGLGTSAVLINSEKGINLFNKISCEFINVSLNEVLRGNPILEKSTRHNSLSKKFWDLYDKKGIDTLETMRSKILLREKISFPIIILKKISKRILK